MPTNGRVCAELGVLNLLHDYPKQAWIGVSYEVPRLFPSCSDELSRLCQRRQQIQILERNIAARIIGYAPILELSALRCGATVTFI